VIGFTFPWRSASRSQHIVAGGAVELQKQIERERKGRIGKVSTG